MNLATEVLKESQRIGRYMSKNPEFEHMNLLEGIQSRLMDMIQDSYVEMRQIFPKIYFPKDRERIELPRIPGTPLPVIVKSYSSSNYHSNPHSGFKNTRFYQQSNMTRNGSSGTKYAIIATKYPGYVNKDKTVVCNNYGWMDSLPKIYADDFEKNQNRLFMPIWPDDVVEWEGQLTMIDGLIMAVLLLHGKSTWKSFPETDQIFKDVMYGSVV